MPDPKMEHYLRGLKLFGEDRYVEAIEAYDEALEIEPEDTEVLHGKAMAQMSAQRVDEAIETGKRIVELNPEDAFAHTSLSIFYQRKGMIDEAEKEAAKARMLSWKEELKRNPNASPPGPAGGGPDVVQ